MNRRLTQKQRAAMSPAVVARFVEDIVGEDLHAKRVASLANGVLGVLHTASLAIHGIGAALAAARDLNPKHATKHVDRLLSNTGVDLDRLLRAWASFVLGARTHVVAALDWTDFDDDDDQTTIVLSLITNHGRATPLLWKTVPKSTLKNQRNDHEDALLRQLSEVVLRTVHMTILADRGFGDCTL